MFAFVGTFDMRGTEPKGLGAYEIGDNGKTRLLKEYCQDLVVGFQCWDRAKNVLYFTHENQNLPGKTGGGGMVIAMKLCPKTGELVEMGRMETCSTNPSYLALDKSGRYLVAVHHSTDNVVTRLVSEGEKVRAEVIYDDCLLELISLNEDGVPEGICWTETIQGYDGDGRHHFPHLHSVVADPSGDNYIISDKGLDRIYVYGINREKGRMFLRGKVDGKTGSAPRYGVFHPTLPIFYGNCEEDPTIYAYKFDVNSGSLTLLETCPLLLENADGIKPMPSDITVNGEGTSIYASVRDSNVIAVIALDRRGNMELTENVNCCGDDPRSVLLSPDGNTLFVTNRGTGSVESFEVQPDGSLCHTGRILRRNHAGNISVFKE